MATREREPCPDRILDDFGGAFGIGAVGGSAYHFLKGLKNSPSGARFAGGAQAVRMNTPRLAGGFAAWGGMFSVLDCTMVYVRQKEDPWNSIMSGAATGALLSMRQGLRVASRQALMTGAFFALVEGAQLLFIKVEAQMTTMQQDPTAAAGGLPSGLGQGQLPPVPVTTATGGLESNSRFGGWFGGGNKKKDAAGGGGGSQGRDFGEP